MRHAKASHTLIGEFRQTSSTGSDRERLSSIAIRAIKGAAAQWGLKSTEVASLMGVSTSTWDRMSAGSWQGALSQDQLTRLSAILPVFCCGNSPSNIRFRYG